MKKKAKRLLQIILRRCAIRVIDKFHPEIIAITGSVGKTSAKDAIYEVLAPKFDIRKSLGNANEEIGVPFTVIGAGSIKNIFDILYKTFFTKNHPEKLVLEMGADHPGDIKYLTSFIKPKVAVVTRVACSHLEYFSDLKTIAKEKGILVEVLKKDGWAILNHDDEYVLEMRERTRAKTLTFGIEKGSDVLAYDIKTSIDGISFKVNYKDQTGKFNINTIGRHQVHNILASICCGIIYEMSLKEISENLEHYKSPKNRMSILKGIKGSTILNDVYNANPESMKAAILALDDIAGGKRKVVALGDMLELGQTSRELHLGISDLLIQKADVVILVGEMMKYVFEKIKNKFKGAIYWFPDSVSASHEVRNIIGSDDIILIKGSHGMRMEKVVDVIREK